MASEEGCLVDSQQGRPLGLLGVSLCACVCLAHLKDDARVHFTGGGQEALTLPV